MSETPSFSSTDLQQAIADARSALEGFDDARNQVSNDIKTLESYLEKLGLTTSFEYSLGGPAFVCEDEQEMQRLGSLDSDGTASGTVREHGLAWGESQGGRFRLMYIVTEWDGYIDVDAPGGGPLFWDTSTKRREVKPLIETKFETRKQMYGHLPDFVQALSDHLSIKGRPKLFDLPF